MTVYICGDSFGYSDSTYGPNWVDLLSAKLDVVNLSRVCASNTHISLQVDRAVANSADYIIYTATSSVRFDARLLSGESAASPLLDKFVDIVNPLPGKALTSYSVRSLDDTSLFTKEQLNVLKLYHGIFFDIDLAVYQNQLIIEGILSRLAHSDIPFKFDQGGFEHASFAGSKSEQYFTNYDQYRSDICLWDYVGPKMPFRPYYHITDPLVHQRVANYYYDVIMKAA